MNHHWKPKPSSDEQAFETLKIAIDGGSNMINSGEFYGVDPPQANLQMLSRFFKANPDYVDKTLLSVKGGMKIPLHLGQDSSTEGLRRSVENINKELGGYKKMDMFECARVDPKVPIEKVMRDLKALIEEGHFKYISLSECSEKSIRRAAKVATISAVEVEYSPFSLDTEHNGVLAACKELNIPVVAYSPLARGILTGSIKKVSDIPEGDMRLHFDRFKPENFDKNMKLVDQLQAIADRKNAPSHNLLWLGFSLKAFCQFLDLLGKKVWKKLWVL